MSEVTDWKRIARVLGLRMEHHAARCEGHDDLIDCPFCADRRAFRMWADAAGYKPDQPQGRSVSITDVAFGDCPKSDAAETPERAVSDGGK